MKRFFMLLLLLAGLFLSACGSSSFTEYDCTTCYRISAIQSSAEAPVKTFCNLIWYRLVQDKAAYSALCEGSPYTVGEGVYLEGTGTEQLEGASVWFDLVPLKEVLTKEVYESISWGLLNDSEFAERYREIPESKKQQKILKNLKKETRGDRSRGYVLVMTVTLYACIEDEVVAETLRIPEENFQYAFSDFSISCVSLPAGTQEYYLADQKTGYSYEDGSLYSIFVGSITGWLSIDLSGTADKELKRISLKSLNDVFTFQSEGKSLSVSAGQAFNLEDCLVPSIPEEELKKNYDGYCCSLVVEAEDADGLVTWQAGYPVFLNGEAGFYERYYSQKWGNV